MSFWNNKNVLITGAMGFIGSSLALDLVREGSNVTTVDNMERKIFGMDGKTKILSHKVSRFLEGDLRSYEVCNAVCQNIDIVIHLASKVGGIGFYTSHASEVINDNICIDNNMLRAAIENNVSKYFYASSAHVYPFSLQGHPDSPPIKEEKTSAGDPGLSYGWAKLISEKQLQYAADQYEGFNVAMARYIGIYGPDQDIDLEKGSVIPVFSHRAIKYPDIDFGVWGTGEETRSYCYIKDAINATKTMIEAMEHTRVVGPYNVGKQEKVSVRHIAETIVNISGKDIDIKYDHSKETKIWGQWCDCTKIEKDLGWKAEITFREGLEKVYKNVEWRLNK